MKSKKSDKEWEKIHNLVMNREAGKGIQSVLNTFGVTANQYYTAAITRGYRKRPNSLISRAPKEPNTYAGRQKSGKEYRQNLNGFTKFVPENSQQEIKVLFMGATISVPSHDTEALKNILSLIKETNEGI